ncbi:Transcriptional regulator, TetR family [Rhodovulum sp. PH10]|uniref:TetR/AcrR family transcriptional regulator n=1 Tax=Rhodovulum sp. PH10 TaxID=1187851 RepID=UPI00027C2393|nr:TetR/AcrR family transcriptional regulator [Rhodovulum sp. PH10]EJW11392.1 Transcriptional regulator, TetR family [Rhodovulum sp. PH10]
MPSHSADADLTKRRRKQIVGAAVHLFSRKGYYRTTMQEIARRARMSAGLIYHYARTKEDVLLLALLHVINTYREQVPPALEGIDDPLARFRAVHAAFCRVVAENIDATVLVYRSTNSLPSEQRAIVKRGELETGEMIAQTIRDCMAAGLFRDLDVELATYQVLMNVHMWALKNWHLKTRFDVDAYIAESADLLVRGFASAEGLRRHLAGDGRPAASLKAIAKP